MGVLKLDTREFLEEGLRQVLVLRIAGTAATLLTFPQLAVPLYQPSSFRAQRSGLAAMLAPSTTFSTEVPGRQFPAHLR